MVTCYSKYMRALTFESLQDYCVKELHLSPSKFHGSARRMVAYARGILREVSALSHCESHDNVVKYNAVWAELVAKCRILFLSSNDTVSSYYQHKCKNNNTC